MRSAAYRTGITSTDNGLFSGDKSAADIAKNVGGEVAIVYLGPVAPHWNIEIRHGDESAMARFCNRTKARLTLLPVHDPQFRRNQERVALDAEREGVSVIWNINDGIGGDSIARFETVADLDISSVGSTDGGSMSTNIEITDAVMDSTDTVGGSTDAGMDGADVVADIDDGVLDIDAHGADASEDMEDVQMEYA